MEEISAVSEIQSTNVRIKKTRSFHLQMITWGINALNHDAAIAVLVNNDLTFWKRSSQFSNVKGDPTLNSKIIKDALQASAGYGPETIVWYENTWLKKSRQLRAGQWSAAFDLNEFPRKYLNKLNFSYAKVKYGSHHQSHAAAGFFTSPFERSAVVVLDAIGEWESASIWYGEGTSLKKIWSRSYPTSLGLFYSSFTDLIGLKPLGEEHILQQWSELGDPKRFYQTIKNYWTADWQLKTNLHRGVWDWPHSFDLTEQDKYDIAAAVQQVFEEQVDYVMMMARKLTNCRNVVYMGGCAMNSKYNRYLETQWDNVWKLDVPGDASSSIGAALYYRKTRIKWDTVLAKSLEIKYNN